MRSVPCVPRGTARAVASTRCEAGSTSAWIPSAQVRVQRGPITWNTPAPVRTCGVKKSAASGAATHGSRPCSCRRPFHVEHVPEFANTQRLERFGFRLHYPWLKAWLLLKAVPRGTRSRVREHSAPNPVLHLARPPLTQSRRPAQAVPRGTRSRHRGSMRCGPVHHLARDGLQRDSLFPSRASHGSTLTSSLHRVGVRGDGASPELDPQQTFHVEHAHAVAASSHPTNGQRFMGTMPAEGVALMKDVPRGTRATATNALT